VLGNVVAVAIVLLLGAALLRSWRVSQAQSKRGVRATPVPYVVVGPLVAAFWYATDYYSGFHIPSDIPEESPPVLPIGAIAGGLAAIVAWLGTRSID
jgi:hypothetical protein